MNYSLVSVLEEEQAEIKKLISHYKRELEKLPPSGEFIRKVDGRFYLYRTHSKAGKIIQTYLGKISEQEAINLKQQIGVARKIKKLLTEAKHRFEFVRKALRHA